MKLYILVSIPIIVLGGIGANLYSRKVSHSNLEAECAQTLCDGDTLPKYDNKSLSLFKIDGKFYTIPRSYGGFNGKLGFFWPSRQPIERGDLANEFKQSRSGTASNFYQVAIEIFIRSPASTGVPPRPVTFKFIQQATINGWVQQKVSAAPGLDEYIMGHFKGASGLYVDGAKYYVATNTIGTDGAPPVAKCTSNNTGNLGDWGGAAFMWNNLWVDIRMSGAHCFEWQHIYPEIVNTLQLVKEVK